MLKQFHKREECFTKGEPLKALLCFWIDGYWLYCFVFQYVRKKGKNHYKCVCIKIAFEMLKTAFILEIKN